MGVIFLGVSVICGLTGAVLLCDFLLWEFTGIRVIATIEGFEKGKPILSFEKEGGEKVKATATRITHMGYFLASPQAGDIFNAAYREGLELEVRVHGSLHLLAGALLFMPGLGYMAVEFSKSWLAGQLSFAVTFVVLVLGGWALMKMLRRNY